MTDRLEAAVKAHQRAQAQAKRVHTALLDAIVEAARDGVQQKDIVRITGYTRERIRQIVRAAEQKGST